MKKIILKIKIPYSVTGNRYATHSVSCKVSEEKVNEVKDLLVDISEMLEFPKYSVELFNYDLTGHEILFQK